MKENITLEQFFQEIDTKKGKKATKQLEQMIKKELSEKNIQGFISSRLSIERKLRILSRNPSLSLSLSNSLIN